ncbi:acyl-CoA carboxylase subunit beta [Corynebacterium lipophiloflavum]|uniref:Carboxyl transferase domain protein n=1 Tax=Corynebacterium lipophiloflavum (strain ATCC 700352 / DSM 44291 / CCUG 37336 / JCM 10383 / DMMZ 1944) TaxID=525263 RepID=C0XV09_CORLD|nr:carboxyl transferase domain-containing protein [Corynebacterium lipophiloflavum]EEI15945.1 carboxyl transferase domain protein [Corynebacterium lipophiloflavum DSM 44291]
MSSTKPDLTTTAGRLHDLRNRLEEAQAPVGRDAIEKVHAAGQSTARERVENLLDPGSFVETDALARHRVEAYKMDRTKPATDGVVTGYGLIDGRRVCVFSQDPTIFDGALGEVTAEKILKIYDLATKTGVPLVGIYDSAGPRMAEGIVAGAMQAKLLRAATAASGLIPQIAVVAGPTSSLASISVPLADLAIMVDRATLHLTDPEIVSKVSGTEATAQSIGGAAVHAATTGLVQLTTSTDEDAVQLARDVIGFLPTNNRAASPVGDNPQPGETDLDAFMPDDDSAAYDVLDIIAAITDGDFLELGSAHADNIVTGFARVGGRAVGIVANQPSVLAGCLTSDASIKAARFIRTCDAFNLPLLLLVDSPGFVPSIEEEKSGVITRAASLAYAFAEAQVGTITVVTRKAIGPSYTLMGAKDLGADLVFAWPTAQIALADAPTAAAALATDADAYAAENLNPYVATERGLVDAVIEPSTTRARILEGLRLLERKVVYPPAKKHGNIPL